jgi:hypothetical protein
MTAFFSKLLLFLHNPRALIVRLTAENGGENGDSHTEATKMADSKWNSRPPSDFYAHFLYLFLASRHGGTISR